MLYMEKENKHFVGYKIQDWINVKVTERTHAALKEKHKQFALDHADDTKEELISYVIDCANILGHSPCKDEVIGGGYIAFRFGGWVKVIIEANLPMPKQSSKPERMRIFQEEYKVQMKCLKQEIEDSREARREQRQKENAIIQEEKEAEKQRDIRWGEEHSADTDEELLIYLKKVTNELGYVPCTRDVVGGQYISKRFGGWTIVLALANLPIPKGMKPPSKKQIIQYYNRSK